MTRKREAGAVVVRILGCVGGEATPHDGRYVVNWNPHTQFGVCMIDTTEDLAKARRFTSSEAANEWLTISKVQPVRPTDGKPNRPLTVFTVEYMTAPE